MTESRKVVRLGVIGCGWVTETRHLPALQNLSDAEVFAVADIDADRLSRMANHFPVKHCYTDFRSLLDNPAVEAVAVCVPTPSHVAVAMAALEARKHVLLEKPLALHLEESDQLIARAAQSPCKVMMGFNMRWHRLIREMRTMVLQGVIGPLECIRTAFTSYYENVPDWRKRRELGGGVWFELAVHHFDLWRFLLQSEVEEIFAVNRCGRWEDETATVTARMMNGILTSSVFAERTGENNEIEIYGQAGRLRVSGYHFDGLEQFSLAGFPGALRVRLRRMVHTLKELPQGALKMWRGGDFLASYQAEWRHFLDAIQRDAPVECTLEDGRRALQIVLAAVESASRGHPVKVAQAPRQVMAATAGSTPAAVRRSVQEQ
jgi:predicted dehydrogenase